MTTGTAELARAMTVTIELIDRYTDTPMEAEAVKIFERIEAEWKAGQDRKASKQRAKAWLKRNLHSPTE